MFPLPSSDGLWASPVEHTLGVGFLVHSPTIINRHLASVPASPLLSHREASPLLLSEIYRKDYLIV